MIFLRTLTVFSTFGVIGALEPFRRRVEQDDVSWMSAYSLVYENCSRSDNVVSFRLCPSENSCNVGCSNGADYVVDLAVFVDAFTEAQLGAKEYRCEMARENCEYDDDALCYQDASLDYCDNANEDENGFNLQEYLECKKISDEYYVGPYCSEDNYNIYLGVFEDEACSTIVESNVFAEVMGYDLPFSSDSIVSNECANCKEHFLEVDQNGGDDKEDDDDVLEQCEELYGRSSKCETDLDVENPDDGACEYIETIQASEGATVGAPKNQSAGSTKTRVWGGVLVAALLFGSCGIAFYLHQHRQAKKDEELNVQDGDNRPSTKKLISA